MTCLRENNNGADLLIGYMEGTLPAAERDEADRQQCRHGGDCRANYAPPPAGQERDAIGPRAEP